MLVGPGSAGGAQCKKPRPAEECRLDVSRLREAFGAETVTVHNCAKDARRVMGRLRTSTMSLAEYMDWWEAHHLQIDGGGGPKRAAQDALEAQQSRLAGLSSSTDSSAEPEKTLPAVSETAGSRGQAFDDSALYYLKDWNFVKAHEDQTQLYVRPPYFAEDWLNDHEAEQGSDHRFVYLGPGGTFTPLHKDVLNSFSWSVNITGRKRWWMLPPESEPALMSTRTGAQLFDLRDPSLGGAADVSEYPQLPQMVGAGGPLVEFEQGVDEVLFVPSGWWHQVANLEDTLSVNHNWINAANIRWSWSYLQQQHARIVAEVPDCADDEETTQQLLEFKYEHNYGTFMQFLLGVREREAARLNAASEAEDRLTSAAADMHDSEHTESNLSVAHATAVSLVLPRLEDEKEGEQTAAIGIRFAPLATDESGTATSSTNPVGSPNALRVGDVVPGSAAAALGPALRIDAELLEIQGQSVAGWHGHCTLRLLRKVAAQRPLRLAFSSRPMASQLSVTELLGAAQAAASAQTRTLREVELVEMRRRVLMSRLSLLRVNRLLHEVMATPACKTSLGADMADMLSAELEEECLQLGTEESLLAAMGVG